MVLTPLTTLRPGTGTSCRTEPADAAGSTMSCVISDVSEAAADSVGVCVTILLASIRSTVAVELTELIKTTGVIAGWGTVNGSTVSRGELEFVGSFAASWEAAGPSGVSVQFPKRGRQDSQSASYQQEWGERHKQKYSGKRKYWLNSAQLLP